MTFTEAAIEVLRRAGKPLHYKEIAEAAVRENLLSHVGQDPDTTMGQRLSAMAKREEERHVVAIAPEGTFALTEWSVPAELVVEAKPPPLPDESNEPPYRSREREPRPIHSQARRRMEAIAAGEEPGDAERRERQERDRERDKDRDRKRSPVAAEAVFDWLAHKQSGAPLSEVAAELAAKGAITEALAHDLPSLTAALLEDNRRRTEAGRKPAFIVDGERVTLVEFPPPSQLAEMERSPQSSLGRPATAAALVQEGKRACVRALRQRLADLETAGFEHVCAALLEKMGMRDVRVAKRSKDGPIYLARHRWGVSDLRVAVRLVRGRREISRQDVLELRKDLAHYSAQMALLLAPGEAGREARAEASAAAQPPVALYAGEALAEELVELRVGVSVQVVEIADVDEAFFAAARALKGGRENRGPREGSSQDGRANESGSATMAASSEGVQSDAAGASPTPANESSTAPVAAASESATVRAEATGASAPARASEESRDGRRRPRRDREERPKMATPADQAWGQPAGTLKKGALSAESAPSPVAGDPASTSSEAALGAVGTTTDASSAPDSAATTATGSTPAPTAAGEGVIAQGAAEASSLETPAEGSAGAESGG